MEKCTEQREPLYQVLIFVDLTKAFYIVNGSALWITLGNLDDLFNSLRY